MLKGWQFTGTDEPLVFVEKPMPELKSGYCLIKVLACGLCHSDTSALHDPGWLNLISTPRILGHETAGEIIEIADDVKNFKVGDRVCIWPMYSGIDGTAQGYTRDGGYANYTAAPEDVLIKVPDSVDIVQAAASTDAGMTSYHAVVDRAEVREGTKVGIIGVGGLGRVATRIAVLQGAQVFCATRKQQAKDDAISLGAFKTADSILDFKDDQLDVVVDFAGAGTTTSDALLAVKPGGRVVVVGMTKLETTVNTNALINMQTELRGSVGGTKESIENVIALMATGDLTINAIETTLDKVPEGLDLLDGAGVPGRLVMRTQDSDFE